MKNKNHKLFIPVIILLFLVVFGIITCAISYNIHKDKVASNVFIDGIDISNLTEPQVTDKIKKHFNDKISNTKLLFTYKDIKESKTLKDLSITFDTQTMINEALNKDKQNNFLIDGFNYLVSNSNRNDLSIKFTINKDSLNTFSSNLNKEINKNKKLPKVNFVSNKINFTPGDPDLSVDSDELVTSISNKLNDFKNTDGNINLKINTSKPSLSSDTFSKMTIIGSYKTLLPNKNIDRTNNIRLFMDKLNGTVIMPDNVFSADKTAGRREIADGYRAAPAFASNQVVDSVAGGICQGVTTIYNAVIYADLQITERAPHAMLVTYAEAGRDATIASGLIDFKFKNNKKNPIVLQSYVSGDGYVVATIWGINENPNREIKIVVEHPTALTSSTYKQTYENGKLIKSEHLSSDKYNAH